MTGRLSSMEAARQVKAAAAANEHAKRALQVVALEFLVASLTGSQTPEMLRVGSLRIRDAHRARKAYAEAVEARKAITVERRGRERKSA